MKVVYTYPNSGVTRPAEIIEFVNKDRANLRVIAEYSEPFQVSNIPFTVHEPGSEKARGCWTFKRENRRTVEYTTPTGQIRYARLDHEYKDGYGNLELTNAQGQVTRLERVARGNHRPGSVQARGCYYDRRAGQSSGPTLVSPDYMKANLHTTNAGLGFKVCPPHDRTYYYYVPGTKSPIQVRVEKVVAVCDRPSGSHRLETEDGKRIYIAPGFLRIDFDIENWSF